MSFLISHTKLMFHRTTNAFKNNHIAIPLLQNVSSTKITSSSSSSSLWSMPITFCFMGTKALIKTNKSAAKRIRLRGSGNVKRNHGGTSHNTGYRSRARNNRLGQTCGIKGSGIEKRMRRLIGN